MATVIDRQVIELSAHYKLINVFVVHSKYFSVSDWLKAHA